MSQTDFWVVETDPDHTVHRESPDGIAWNTYSDPAPPHEQVVMQSVYLYGNEAEVPAMVEAMREIAAFARNRIARFEAERTTRNKGE